MPSVGGVSYVPLIEEVAVDTGLEQPLTDAQLRAISVPVQATQKITNDATNTSTTLLLAGATFAGGWVDTEAVGNETSMISISVKSDVASATDGIVLEWSHAGAAADIALNATYAPSSLGTFYATRRMRYYRTKYVNGGTNQATFLLVVDKYALPLTTPIIPLATRLRDDFLAAIGRSVTSGKIIGGADDGLYGNISAIKVGNPATTFLPVLNGARPSQIPGRTHINQIIVDAGTYTVTVGKKLYITSFTMGVTTTAVAVPANRSVTDGGVAFRATPYQGTASVLITSETLPEPLAITTNVALSAAPAGVSTVFNFSGYEETL